MDSVAVCGNRSATFRGTVVMTTVSMRVFLVLDDLLGALGGGDAGGLLQLAERLHLRVRFLRPAERAVDLRKQKMRAGLGGIGLDRGFEVADGLRAAIQLDQGAGLVYTGFAKARALGKRLVDIGKRVLRAAVLFQHNTSELPAPAIARVDREFPPETAPRGNPIEKG